MTSDDEGEGGVRIPPKNDDVIYEQPLSGTASYTDDHYDDDYYCDDD